MSTKRAVWITAWVASFAVFAAGVAHLVSEQRTDRDATADAALPALAAMPFPAGVTPLSSPTLSVGDQVVLGVEANSQHGVASISLYDGARRVLTVPADEGRSTTTVRSPVLTVGPHAIYTAITDGDGRRSLSPVTQVDVAAAAAPPPLEAPDATRPSDAEAPPGTDEQPVAVTVDAEPGETAGSVADRFGVDEDQVTVAAAGADDQPIEVGPADEIPDGAAVVIRVPRDNGTGKQTTPVVTEPEVDDAFGDGSDLTLSAKATGTGCVVELTADGGAGEVTFYRGSSGTPGWATTGRATGERTAQVRSLAPGAHVFVARDAEGTTSPPVSVTAPAACRAGTGWTGSAAIVDGNLLLPAQVAGGRTYLYLRVGNHSYRVPQGQDEYVTSAATTPIGAYLPRLAGDSLALEVWTDHGGGPFSAQAEGTLDVPDGETITSIIGEPSGLRLSGRSKGTIPFSPAIVLVDRDRELEFRWTSASTRVTKVMWQVLIDGRPSTDHKLAPGDLIASGTSEMTGTDASGTTGRFTIDTAQIPGRDPDLGGEGQTVGDSGFTGTQIVHPPYTPGNTSTIPDRAFATAPQTIDVSDVEEPVLDLPSHGDTVQVRVVALTDDVAAASASSTYPVTLPTPDGLNGKPVDMVVTDARYDAGRAANPWLADCVKLTVPWKARYPRNGKPGGGFNSDNTFYGYGYGPDLSFAARLIADGQPGAPPGGWTTEGAQLSWTYAQSGPICPDRNDPDAECDGFFICLAEAVGELYSIVKSLATAVVDLYNAAIDTVVQAIVKYSGICQIVGQASDSKDAQATCKVVMTTVTKAAIGVVLAMAGLPVSLPRPDDIERALQGDVARVLATMATQLGLPCDDLRSADPEDLAALGGAAGIDTTSAEAAADPCLALARAAVGFIQEQVLDDTSAATAASGPWPNVVAIPGANLIPHPGGRPTAQTFGITLQVEDANAVIAPGFLCGVRARVTTAGWTSTWLDQAFWLQPSADGRTWTGSVASAEYLTRRSKETGATVTAFSPWNPKLAGPTGPVISAASDGTATATFDTSPSLFPLPSGGLGINQCVADPVTRVSPIGPPAS